MGEFVRKPAFPVRVNVSVGNMGPWVLAAALLLSLVALPGSSGKAKAQEPAAFAVLPFQVHAVEPLDHLRLGVQDMLTARVGSRGLDALDPGIVNKHPMAFAPDLSHEQLRRVGLDLNAKWIASGSATQIGEKISVDLTVVDVEEERPPLLFFMVAENAHMLPETVGRLAASIYNEISGVVQVDSVRVAGNQRIEADAVLAVIETDKGDPFDQEQLDKDLRSVFKMGYFMDVEIETEEGAKGRIITFRVSEKPSIGGIVFEGNEEVEDDVLKKEIGISLYSILDRNKVKQSINRLKEYYRQEAYYNVQIEEEISPLPENQVLLKYKINESEKVFVREIRFEGNKHFDDDKLRDIMETSEKGFFSWITDSGYLDTKKLEFDTHKIASFYHNNGFIKAKVGDPQVEYKKSLGLVITIEIEEGEKYKVDNVDFRGELIEPEEELLKRVMIDQEEVFRRETLRRDVLELKELYAAQGYAYSEVVPLTREDDEAHLVDITYNISKGAKVKFERINISGNEVTRDKVIRRELKVEEGEYFDGEALKRSTENLNRLGYFEDVEIQTKKGSEEDLMVLDIKVKERPTGSFSFGAGYSSVDDVIGTARVEQDNLFGYGQSLFAAIRIGGRSNEFEVRFTEPWLMNRPISGTLGAYKWEREYDEYTKDAFGGTAAIGYPLNMFDDYTRGWTEYRYEDADVTDVDDDASYFLRQMEGRSVTSSITVGIRRNSTDKPWNTSKGSINSLSVEYAGGPLGGDNYFNKYLARTTWFFPLPWDTVFMVQGRWGYIKERSGGDLPVYEKFFLGGMNSVRGFDYADISPRDAVTGDKVGGEKMMCYNVEYRFPLIKDQGVIGLVFFDAGKVTTSEPGTVDRKLGTSVGAGVRWYSPMGPLRLEWGYNLDPQFDEDSSQVEFSIGTMF